MPARARDHTKSKRRDLLLIDPDVTYVDVLVRDVSRLIRPPETGGGELSRPSSSRGRRGIGNAAHSTLWPSHFSRFFQPGL